jgi:hypothetical protein
MRKEAWSSPRAEVRTGILKRKSRDDAPSSKCGSAAVYSVSNLDESTLKKYEGNATQAFKTRPRRKTSADIALAKAPNVCCCLLQ